MKYKKIIIFVLYIFRLPFLFLIRFYQKTFSPDHGLFKAFFPHGYCKFYPSCSEYARQTIKKDGLLLGFLKTGWRILRCNPWSKGGVDIP